MHSGDKAFHSFAFFPSFFDPIHLLCISVYTDFSVDMHEFQKSRHPAQEMLWKHKTDTVNILSELLLTQIRQPRLESQLSHLLTLWAIYFTSIASVLLYVK